ncbi:MAG: 1-acyl-sn-glycerol-3-phosphate acyltransferase [Candidatus Omnitrophica bacterium]|nr:1-acyl-sn-glycerol-3-phosphate acyltransferase [Candidatus Omnitrophota bacterium]
MIIAYRISRIMFEIAMRILFHLHVVGKENIPSRPYIIVSNHSSLVDPPLVGMAFKRHDVSFLTKEELFSHPIIGVWTKNVECIPIRRGSASAKGLKEALKRVKDGKVIGIFPEGTRSLDGSLQEAKKGVGFLIRKAGVPVVPVYVKNSQKALPVVGGAKVGTHIYLKIGKPLAPDRFFKKTVGGKADYEEIANVVMREISVLKKESEAFRD